MDRLFFKAHDEVFEEVDCLSCANCCSTISPIFKSRDVERLSRFLKMKPGAFIEEYLILDDDDDYVLKSLPCPFLGDDNYCGVYDHRPSACREYPHTNHRNMRVHLGLAKKNCVVCPAVVKVLQTVEVSITKKAAE